MSSNMNKCPSCLRYNCVVSYSVENWEAFKYALNKNKHAHHSNPLENDDIMGLQQQQHLQQKRNLANNLGMSHFNGIHSEFLESQLRALQLRL